MNFMLKPVKAQVEWENKKKYPPLVWFDHIPIKIWNSYQLLHITWENEMEKH